MNFQLSNVYIIDNNFEFQLVFTFMNVCVCVCVCGKLGIFWEGGGGMWFYS